jgi:hypothetical protein
VKLVPGTEGKCARSVHSVHSVPKECKSPFADVGTCIAMIPGVCDDDS